MKLLSVNVSLPEIHQWKGKEISTSFFKKSVGNKEVQVFKTTLAGDQVADPRVHGGEDKAIYSYSLDTYSWWMQTLGLSSLEPGAMGENLSFDAFDENKIYVGDIFQVGSCQIQAVQPRQPCFKMEIRFPKSPEIVKTFLDYDRPGIYFRVIKEGFLKAGDQAELIFSEKEKVSINEIYRFYKDKKSVSKERARQIADVPSMNAKWRTKFLDHSLS